MKLYNKLLILVNVIALIVLMVTITTIPFRPKLGRIEIEIPPVEPPTVVRKEPQSAGLVLGSQLTSDRYGVTDAPHDSRNGMLAERVVIRSNLYHNKVMINGHDYGSTPVEVDLPVTLNNWSNQLMLVTRDATSSKR